METIIKKWGNSASVRIPARIMAAVNLQVEDAVVVREDSGRIVIEPTQPKAADLSELIKGIKPKNLHIAIDFGEPTGNELL